MIAFSHSDKTQTVELSTWSAWQPTRGDGDPIQQIVDHVGPEYRLPSGKQIVAVTGGPSQIEGIPLVVALRSDPAKNGDEHPREQERRPLPDVRPRARTARSRRASPPRSAACYLRREALELALYTFNYVADIDGVAC